ncbi:bifunctional riboflavin kinase/FAD synthetase [Namhaeicola litoreus]|uniref:Riboflavin biosynthesis protein n=1 Tax=Namhaeicola litoreus TaxID=1052145 RepID=A0ABW3XYZ9_9FLAO
MRVHQSIIDFSKKNIPTVLTIGTFDGVHIGHQKIIERLNELKKESLYSAILTFYPHPRRVLGKENQIQMLNSFQEKKDLLAMYKLDHLIVEPFTERFSQTSAEDFVRNILVNELNVKKLVIGHDHKFGKNREGDFDKLVELSRVYDFAVEEIPSQDIENIAVSSTKIRKALLAGDVLLANRYLGYPYILSGKVVKGHGIGRTINFPTINIQIEEDYKLIPKNGVYIVRTEYNGIKMFGLMNIGTRPTLNGQNRSIEVYLLDFSGDLYGKILRVEILNRLRDETKFDSIDGLKKQIAVDEILAREWLRNR